MNPAFSPSQYRCQWGGGGESILFLQTPSYLVVINKLKTLVRSSLTLPSDVCVCVLFTAVVAPEPRTVPET